MTTQTASIDRKINIPSLAITIEDSMKLGGLESYIMFEDGRVTING